MKNHLTDAEAEMTRLCAGPRTAESQRRIAQLQAIVAEHRVGNQTTVFA